MKKSILTLLLLPSMGWAQTQTFDQVWKKISEKSYSVESASQQAQADEIALSRADDHWLPRVYAGAKWFGTNDSAQVLFSNLGQRSVEAADFVPAQLNEPGFDGFLQGNVGLDWAVYEGGAKSKQVSMMKLISQSSQLETKAQKNQEYAQTAKHYGHLVLIQEAQLALESLSEKIKQLIAQYQVGAKQNPVGYSGLLGLKGVLNRVEGNQSQFSAESSGSKAWIDSKMEDEAAWNPEGIFPKVVSNFTMDKTATSSHVLESYRLKAQSMSLSGKMEKARYMPRVGLFAQNQFYQGSRDFENSQTLGLYLNWNLFDPDSSGRVKEAVARARAMETKVLAQAQEEKSATAQLESSKIALEKSLSLLDNSESLLEEQTREAMKLFKNGMITALQLSEVLNRRVDLIEQRKQARQSYLNVLSQLYILKKE